MIIPRLGYDVRKRSRRAGPPDVEIPTDDAELASRHASAAPVVADARYSCIDGMYEMPTIAPSGDSSRTTV